MNIKGLKVFTLIFEQGTLARASNVMNLSPPAVSRLLRLLEDHLGYPLFDRRKKRLIPTPAAERLYPDVLRILTSIDELPNRMAEIEQGDQLPLKVVCNPRLMNGVILPALAQFQGSHPGARVFVDIATRRNFARFLAMGQFHLGLGTIPAPTDVITPEPLRDTPLGVLVHKDSPLATRDSLGLGDLAGEQYIALPVVAIARQIIDAELARTDLVLTPKYELSTSESAHRLVARIGGFTFTERHALGDQLDPRVRLIPLKPRLVLRLGLFRTPFSNHPLAEPFIDHIKAVLDRVH